MRWMKTVKENHRFLTETKGEKRLPVWTEANIVLLFYIYETISSLLFDFFNQMYIVRLFLNEAALRNLAS